MFIKGGVEADRLALAAFGPQFLTETALVVGDQGVSGLEDASGGAVVLLEADGYGVLEVFAELVEILHPSAAPAVDRLVVVAHHHQTVAAFGQQAQPGVLHGVGVLELVHQDVPEAALVVIQQAWVIAPEVQRAQQ